MTETPWYLQEFKKIMASKDRVVPLVHKMLIEKRLTSTRDTTHLHPSEICKKDWCTRSSWYTIKGYPATEGALSFQRLNVFEEGHHIHRKWQKWMEETGHLVAAELPIYNEEHMLMGHADALLNIDEKELLIEIKSVGVGTFRFENYDLFKDCEGNGDEMWKKLRQPFPSHVRQAMLYMYATGVHDLVFIYEWKPTQDVKEFSLKYQPEFIEEILEKCKLVKRHVENDTVPLRPAWVDGPTHNTCKYCPYKTICWRNDDTSSSEQQTKDSDGEVQREVLSARKTEGGDARDTDVPRRVIRR